MNRDQSVEKPSGIEYGPTLKGMGLNLLVSKVSETTRFLTNVLELVVVYEDEDFAIVKYHDQEFMLHSDASYSENPLLGLTGDGVLRGAGLELRLYQTDPDRACTAAEAGDHFILQKPMTKGHGLREAYIVGPDGYVWVPSVKV